MYVRNYGQGQTWLPGKMTEVHGFVLYSVLFDDGRSVRKHIDQLWMRASDMATVEDCQGDDDIELPSPGSTEAVVGTNNTDTASGDPPLPSTSPRTLNIPEPRRSDRVRQPPNRFGEPLYFGTLNSC